MDQKPQNSSPAGDVLIGPSTCQSSCRTWTRLQGHMVLIQRLEMCLKLIRSHAKHEKIKSCRCRDWKEKFNFSDQTLDSSCCSAGFTNFWMFPSMFSIVSEFLCFLDLWSSVRIQQTTSRTVDVYSRQNYWLTLESLETRWDFQVRSPWSPERFFLLSSCTHKISTCAKKILTCANEDTNPCPKQSNLCY